MFSTRRESEKTKFSASWHALVNLNRDLTVNLSLDAKEIDDGNNKPLAITVALLHQGQIVVHKLTHAGDQGALVASRAFQYSVQLSKQLHELKTAIQNCKQDQIKDVAQDIYSAYLELAYAIACEEEWVLSDSFMVKRRIKDIDVLAESTKAVVAFMKNPLCREQRDKLNEQADKLYNVETINQDSWYTAATFTSLLCAVGLILAGCAIATLGLSLACLLLGVATIALGSYLYNNTNKLEHEGFDIKESARNLQRMSRFFSIEAAPELFQSKRVVADYGGTLSELSPSR